MQPIEPDQARYLFEAVYLPSLQNEHRTTRRVLEAVPVDKGDYRPDDVAKTALELSWHIAVSEMRFMETVIAGALDASSRPMPDSVRNSADLITWYTSEFEKHVERLKQLTDEQLAQIVDFRGLLKQPAVLFLGLLQHHSVHHRGQLSVYLRPMGAKVPAIYGESYDSAQARKG